MHKKNIKDLALPSGDRIFSHRSIILKECIMTSLSHYRKILN